MRTSDDTVFTDKASLTVSSSHSRKTVAFLLRVVIFLALSLSIFLIKNQTHYQGHAAGVTAIRVEAESGSLSGPATVIADTTASGGQYVRLNSSSGGSTPTPAPTATTTPTSPQTGMNVSLGWDYGGMLATNTPWNDITEDVLFSIKTTNGSSLDTSFFTNSNVNVSQWVSNVHSHNKVAFIAIGGSDDTTWIDACNNTYRSAFVTNLVNYMKNNGFDGIEVDMEDYNITAINPPVPEWDACIQAISNAARAITTAAGKTPLISVDIITNWEGSWYVNDTAYIDQWNLMTYGDTSTCNTTTSIAGCSTFASDIQSTLNQLNEPASFASKFVIGICDDPGSGDCTNINKNIPPQATNQTYSTTTNSLTSGSQITSIPVSSLSTSISAGNIILDTTENPPAHYQVFTTTGAAAGTTSIPVSAQTVNYSYPSGSNIQDVYMGPWECGNDANYAVQQGLMGTALWWISQDAANHNGSYACFDQIGKYVGVSNPSQIPTSTPTPVICTVNPPTGLGADTIANVSIASTGTYNVYSRMSVPVSGNSLYLKIDNGCPTLIADNANVNTWDWIPAGQLTYTSGTTHTITLYGNSANVKVDAMLFSQSCTPTGTGDNCVNPPPPKPTATTAPTQQPGTGSLTFIKSASAKGNFGAGISITIPASVQAGDLLIAAAGTNGTPATWRTPRGWNKGAGSGTTQSQGLHWFWKVANGTEGGTKVQLKSSSYADGGGIVAVYRGASGSGPIAGVSSLKTNDNGGSFQVTSATVNGISLSNTTNVVPLILTSWQPSDATVSWPADFIAEASATDGYGHVAIGESLSSLNTSSVNAQTLNFSTAQSVMQTLQIAVSAGQ